MQARPAVVLTRQEDDNRKLAALLEARAVPVIQIPCVATRYVAPGPLPSGVDAVVFTSRRGVRGLLEDAHARERLRLPDARGHREPPSPVVAALGPATAEALGLAAIRVDLVADPPEGRVLARMLAPRLAPRACIALVRGNLRAGALDEILMESGYRLIPLTVYENYEPDIPAFAPFPVAAVFVASPSAARRLCSTNPWITGCPFVAIGPTTASALEGLGIAGIRRAGDTEAQWVETLHSAFKQALARELNEKERS